jgi:hypothetical protein
MKNEPETYMHIAEVERDTGIGKDTLRVWERRYQFPQPYETRTASALPFDRSNGYVSFGACWTRGCVRAT